MLKTTLAIGAGKMTASLVSLLRLGAGTSLPGKVARRIDPGLLESLGAQIRERTVAVTGTNGKTTTCGLLSQFLETADKRVFHNQLGANMLPGITSAILRQSSLFGHLDAEIGVLEVDEASLRGVASEVKIDQVVVTNLFRDQLDRYGELDTTARLIAAGIEKTRGQLAQGQIVLNADDPLVTTLGRERSGALYFGIDAVTYAHMLQADCPVVFPTEVTACPVCGSSLRYDAVIFGHLGHYHCSDCDYTRPKPDVLATHVAVDPDGSKITLDYGGEIREVYLPLPGLFNVYNFLAAAAVVYSMGLPADILSRGVGEYRSVFGRAERLTLGGKSVMVMLIKNPTGASEVLKLVGGDPNGRLLIALNDGYADGRDVSWIWDAMFEVVPPQKTIVVSGVRAEDMAIRLKYAGVPQENLRVERDLKAAVEMALAEVKPGETLYVLPTYTALLALRKLFHHL